VANEYKPPYPPQAKADEVEGAVICEVSIDETGKVTAVKVLEGPGHGLNEAARDALLRFTFKPAIKDGQAVATAIQWNFRFELPAG
jgi:protein TonB